MNQTPVVDYRAAKTDFELLDAIRSRYQMFANDIRSLRGILTGYALAKEDYEQNIGQFSSYLKKLKGVNPHAVSWDMVISDEAEKPDYEIPLFYHYLDEYRKIDHEILGVVELDAEQREFDFRRNIKTINMDYPELPLKAPHKLVAVKAPNARIHAFYYDEKGNKYYEQCFTDLSYLKNWARECFNIIEKNW